MAVSERLEDSRTVESYYVIMGIVADVSVHMLTIAQNCWSFTHYKTIRNPLLGVPIYELYYFPFEEQEPHSVLLLAPGCTWRIIYSINQLFHDMDYWQEQSAEGTPTNPKTKRDNTQDICYTNRKYHMIKDGKLHICPPSSDDQSRHNTGYAHPNDSPEWYG